MSRTMVRYSEAFKLQVVEEVEKGRFRSCFEASLAYGIAGNDTVPRWMRQYGKEHLLGKVVRVTKQGEPTEIKRLKDRVRELETALSNAHIDSALNEAFFEILCERTGIDAETFKKKHAGMASTGRTRSKAGK